MAERSDDLGAPSGVPPEPMPHVDRPALTDALDTATASGPTLVAGGCGWGKTTTVAAWAAGRPACWLTLNGDDSSCLHLARRILGAVRSTRPDLPDDLSVANGAVRGRRPAVSTVIRALGAVLTSHPEAGLAIVLDGLERLPAEGEAMDLVAGLCRLGSSGPRLVLITRRVPEHRLAAVPGLALMDEVGPPSLAFDADEVAALLRGLLGRTDPAQVQEVWSLTSGWPAAVRVIGEALRSADRPGPVPAASARIPLDTLAEQALADEPEPMRRLLVDATVLGTIDAPLAEALGHRGAATAIAVLARRGLLRLAGSSWSVLPPVRDLLSRTSDPGSPPWRELHARAGAFQVSRDEYASALRSLIAAGDGAAVARLLVEHGEALLAAGEAAAVADAAAVLDPRVVDPWVLVVLGRARRAQGDWLGALSCFRAAAAGFHAAAAGSRAATGAGTPAATVALELGHLYFLTGSTDKAVEAFEQAGVDEPATADEVRLFCEAAFWLRAAGQDDRAEAVAARGAQAADGFPDPAVRADCYRALAVFAAHSGDRSANDMYHQLALRMSVELGDDQLRLRLLINRASYLVEDGSPTEAVEAVEAALQLDMKPDLVPFCYSIRGRARARVGRFDEALADLDAAAQLWQQIGPSLDVPFGLLARGDVHRRRGEPGQAQAALEEALRLTSETATMRPLRAVMLATLARVRAAGDLVAAGALAEEAVGLVSGVGRVPCLLARGWVRLLSGQRAAAAADAAQARTLAGLRRDRGGLAEAIELATFSAARPASPGSGWSRPGRTCGGSGSGSTLEWPTRWRYPGPVPWSVCRRWVDSGCCVRACRLRRLSGGRGRRVSCSRF